LLPIGRLDEVIEEAKSVLERNNSATANSEHAGSSATKNIVGRNGTTLALRGVTVALQERLKQKGRPGSGNFSENPGEQVMIDLESLLLEKLEAEKKKGRIGKKSENARTREEKRRKYFGRKFLAK